MDSVGVGRHVSSALVGVDGATALETGSAPGTARGSGTESSYIEEVEANESTVCAREDTDSTAAAQPASRCAGQPTIPAGGESNIASDSDTTATPGIHGLRTVGDTFLAMDEQPSWAGESRQGTSFQRSLAHSSSAIGAASTALTRTSCHGRAGPSHAPHAHFSLVEDEGIIASTGPSSFAGRETATACASISLRSGVDPSPAPHIQSSLADDADNYPDNEDLMVENGIPPNLHEITTGDQSFLYHAERSPMPAQSGLFRARSASSSEPMAWLDGMEDLEFETLIFPKRNPARQLLDLPNEILFEILGYLDISDLLATSRTSRHLRQLSLAPILHHLRLRRTRAILPPMLTSPMRPSLADLIARHIFLTNTTVLSRKLARSLVSIRLSRRLAARPSAEALVERCVLPPECIPGKGVDGSGLVAPALVAKKKAVERERLKDGLRRWIGSVWKGEVRTREESVRLREEKAGVGRVWRLRRFWERIGKGDSQGTVS